MAEEESEGEPRRLPPKMATGRKAGDPPEETDEEAIQKAAKAMKDLLKNQPKK